MPAIELGLAGFGQLAQAYYAPALKRLGLARHLHVADRDPAALAAAARLFPQARLHGDVAALLSEGRVAALLVATPPSTHLAVWEQAKARSMPVFMEKPFLLEHEVDGVDPADPAWRRLMIDFNRRFWPAYRSLRGHVESGRLGTLSDADFTLRVKAGRWTKGDGHRADAREGGVLYDLGSHLFDLVHVTFGQTPVDLVASRDAVPDVDDGVVTEFRFADGLSVRCHLGYGRRNQESVRIRGTERTLSLNEPNGRVWLAATGSGRRLDRDLVDLGLLGYRGLLRQRSMLRASICAALAAFLRSVTADAPLEPGIGDAFRVARWLRSAKRSLETGDSVRLRPVP